MISQSCSFPATISKATVRAMLSIPQSYGVIDNQNQSSVLQMLNKLEDHQWEIVSFNPQTREVCVNITNNVGSIHMPIILPKP